jgi:hypothetical protein
MLETENDKKDSEIDTLNQLIDYTCRLAAKVKEKQSAVTTAVYVNNDGNDEAAPVYGFFTIAIKSSDTLDKLAQDYLGDADLWQLIASFNGIQNENDLEAGSIIKIPVITRKPENYANRIYSNPEDQDLYGRDIKIADNGDFAVSGGDLAVISGQENLHQALENRMTTAAGKRIRIGAYGIRSAIGDPMAVKSYLLSSIEQTVLEDPRIEQIEEIAFESKGSYLNIYIEYTDLNRNKNIYEGKLNG